MGKIIVLSFVCLSLFSSCKKKSINCDRVCTYAETKLFNFGFEDVELIQSGNSAGIIGLDSGYPDLNNWDSWLQGKNEYGSLSILYEDGDISERIAELVTDPENPDNTVLHFDIKSPNVYEGDSPVKARTQMQLHNATCIKEYYQKVDLYFPSELALLSNYSEQIYWLSIFELWNNANWTKEKYPFRITVGLQKEEGVGNPIYFDAEAQLVTKFGSFKNVWSEVNTNFEVPFGQWMTLEIYILEGNETNGKFYSAVTPYGESKQVLFEIDNATQHPKEKCADGFTHIHPLKWYTSDKIVNYMKDNGESLAVYWDNWEVWVNKAP
ncbi:MAG: hypothetical protein GQ574_01270 [Crocinitomix sp.]|nr:hypothetical protein [Crocinitomix sp.]